MAVGPRPEYDPPLTTVGETRFGRRERDEMSRRALLLPAKIKFEPDQEGWFHELDAGSRTAHTYKFTYELMMRGLGVQLIVQEIHRDTPGDWRDFFAKTFTYTTQLPGPYAQEIDSLAAFGSFVPWRESGPQGPVQVTRFEYYLFVSMDDREEELEVLKELKITLNAVWHPDQAWWQGRAVHQAESAFLGPGSGSGGDGSDRSGRGGCRGAVKTG